jgi:hypothetical protein
MASGNNTKFILQAQAWQAYRRTASHWSLQGEIKPQHFYWAVLIGDKGFFSIKFITVFSIAKRFNFAMRL